MIAQDPTAGSSLNANGLWDRLRSLEASNNSQDETQAAGVAG